MNAKLNRAGLLALLVSLPAAAQSAAGSESYVAVARIVPTAADECSSASYSARLAVGLAANFESASSTSWRLVSGPASIEGSLVHTGPIVYGADLAQGTKDGGELRRVFGFGLDAAPQSVAFGGASSPSVTPVTPTALDVVTPVGTNGFGNPFGPTDVSVSTAAGTDARDAAFTYLPALTQERLAVLGCELELAMRGTPLSFFILAVGGTFPGVAIPVPPFDGALEIISPWIVLGGLRLNITGVKVNTFKLPNDPAFAFATVDFQSLEITTPAGDEGAFTNVVPVTLVP